MKRIPVLILIGLLGAAFLFGGCGEDKTVTNTVYVTDTLTITDTLTETPPAHISGYVFVDPELYMYADIYSYGPLEPIIDSVIVADSQAVVGLWTSISVIELVGFAVYDNATTPGWWLVTPLKSKSIPEPLRVRHRSNFSTSPITHLSLSLRPTAIPAMPGRLLR